MCIISALSDWGDLCHDNQN